MLFPILSAVFLTGYIMTSALCFALANAEVSWTWRDILSLFVISLAWPFVFPAITFATYRDNLL